jgi:mono/diheme cytochrome c family protein
MKTHDDAPHSSIRRRSWTAGGALAMFLFLMLVGATWSEEGGPPVGPKEGAPLEAPKASDASAAPKEVYAGVQVCRECHTEEYRIWVGVSHARAFVALQTATARRISEEPGAYAGMPTPKMLKDCAPCHARGMEASPVEREKTFRAEEGVHCESCHGPRGLHAKSKAGQKPGDKLDEGGTVVIARSKTSVKEQCMTCHKEKPSHVVLGRPAFDFDTAWKKIAHGHAGGEALK